MPEYPIIVKYCSSLFTLIFSLYHKCNNQNFYFHCLPALSSKFIFYHILMKNEFPLIPGDWLTQIWAPTLPHCQRPMPLLYENGNERTWHGSLLTAAVKNMDTQRLLSRREKHRIICRRALLVQKVIAKLYYAAAGLVLPLAVIFLHGGSYHLRLCSVHGSLAWLQQSAGIEAWTGRKTPLKRKILLLSLIVLRVFTLSSIRWLNPLHCPPQSPLDLERSRHGSFHDRQLR